MNTKIIALIPARSGSKGVPNKNLRPLCGRPLLEWSIAACLKSQTIERTIVSTDSEEYAKIARGLGAEAPFLRPSDIATDTSTDYEFVLHALDFFKKIDEEPEFIVHIRPTTPMRDPRVVDEAVRAFISDSKASAMRSVHEMSESAYKSFEITDDRRLKQVGARDSNLDAANNARQSFPKTYYGNGYVDVLSVAFIREHRLLHGDRIVPWITDPVVEVDTEEDFSLLEFQATRSPERVRALFN